MNWLRWLKTRILYITGSQLEITLLPMGHMAMAGDISGCSNLKHGCSGHPEGRNQRCCYIFYYAWCPGCRITQPPIWIVPRLRNPGLMPCLGHQQVINCPETEFTKQVMRAPKKGAVMIGPRWMAYLLLPLAEVSILHKDLANPFLFLLGISVLLCRGMYHGYLDAGCKTLLRDHTAQCIREGASLDTEGKQEAQWENLTCLFSLSPQTLVIWKCLELYYSKYLLSQLPRGKRCRYIWKHEMVEQIC